MNAAMLSLYSNFAEIDGDLPKLHETVAPRYVSA